MNTEVALGIACTAVVVVVLLRLRPGRGKSQVSTGLFTVSAEQADQSAVNIRDVKAGRDVRLAAEKIDAETVEAGRDFSAEASRGGRNDPLA